MLENKESFKFSHDLAQVKIPLLFIRTNKFGISNLIKQITWHNNLGLDTWKRTHTEQSLTSPVYSTPWDTWSY